MSATLTKSKEWRPVVGYEGWYEISIDGDIRRVKTVAGARAGRVLKLSMNRKGYRMVGLSKLGIVRGYFIHRLLYEAYRGPIPCGMFINHIDGVKLNNSLENLEITTPAGNSKHAGDNHLIPSGESHWNWKLTKDQVAEIRSNGKTGSWRSIATKYGVSVWNIRDIITQRSRTREFEAG